MDESNSVLFSRDKDNDDASGANSSSDAVDVWDDTLLIEAYDKAVKIAKESCFEKTAALNEKNKKTKKKGTVTPKWNVGDKCRCRYSEDLKFYEADIINLNDALGTCTVRYVGYENTEVVPLKSLKQSGGETCRSQQIRDASNDNFNEGCFNSENHFKKTQYHLGKPTGKKKNFHKCKKTFLQNGDLSTSISPAQSLNSIVPPPPPPPHLFKNMSEDEDETEAMSAMLIAWYMSGYHTGYYQGLKIGKQKK